MKLIISPAKKMREEDFLPPETSPEFLEQSKELLSLLQKLPYDDLKKLLSCNDAIARLNFERFQAMDLGLARTPALLAYDGIQYQYMAPQLFTDAQFSYVGDCLRILSGFYGLLRPFDAVVPYRLEMQAKLRVGNRKNLYEFWGDALARSLEREDRVIVNLASGEYARAVRPYLHAGTRFLTCVFGEQEGERLVEKGVYVKMVRGEMVRWLAERQARSPEEMKGFCRLGYRYREELSTETSYVFVRETEEEKSAPKRREPRKK